MSFSTLHQSISATGRRTATSFLTAWRPGYIDLKAAGGLANESLLSCGKRV